ncbi:MAG: hypothetical protein RLZZ262_2550 [Bacteroidota bacterium]
MNIVTPIFFSAFCLLSGVDSPKPPIKCLTDLAGPKRSMEVAIEELLDVPYILNPDSLKSSPSPSVSSFMLTISSNIDVELMQTNSNRLSTKQFNAIGYANVGDKIYIENIILNYPDGQGRKLGPLTFTIVSRTKISKPNYGVCGGG